jgi:protein SCO1/2
VRQHDSHESYEVFAGRLHWIAAIIVVCVAATIWLMYVLAHTWLGPLPVAPRMPAPVAPRLLADPHPELEEVRKREHAALEQYQWLDPQRGIARIPIQRAMELMSQPERTNTTTGVPPKDPAPTPGRPDSPIPAAHVRAPADLTRRVGFDQHLGASLPATATFRDSDGSAVTLAQLAGGHPLLLALGYYGCPNLCDTTLRGIGHAVAFLPVRPGTDFQIAFVSIDPHETPPQAAAAAQTLARDIPTADVTRWHFLTGNESDIRSLANTLGYRYWFDPRLSQYAHPAGIVITTAQAQVAQYFFGLSFPPDALRLALVGASHGRLGNVIDQLVLLCCGYDPTTGRYSLLIGRIAIVVCGGFLLAACAWLWMTVKRRIRT